MTESKSLKPVREAVVERSLNILKKSWEGRVFTKLYHSLRTSGLLARLSNKDFKTLICLSTYMDHEGHCFPSQEALAQALGISQGGVSKRIKSLLSFRWKGKPLVSARKIRGWKGLFENTVYTILPESSLRIFDENGSKPSHMNTSYMDSVHTNQNQTRNKILNNVMERKISSKIDPLAQELAKDMGDIQNLAYYEKMVREVPASILLQARGEVLEEKNIKKSRGAMFNFLVKKHIRSYVGT